MWRAALLAGLCWALSGCTPDVVGPDSGPLLRRDSTRYVLRLVPAGPDAYVVATLRMNVAFTFTNRTGHQVLAGGCSRPDRPFIQKRSGSEWLDAWGNWYLLCQAPPLPIAEGASYSSVLEVWVPATSPSTAPQWPAGDIEGTYRLYWPALEQVTNVQRTSNEFTVVPG